MLNQATMDMLTAMKMTAMPAEFANQLKDPTFNELGFEERLGLLVNAEWNRRQSNKLNRFIRNARFAVPPPHYPQGSLWQRQDLHRLCPGQCRLPPFQEGAVHPYARAAGRTEHCPQWWNTEKGA